jgi:hypothetical protein
MANAAGTAAACQSMYAAYFSTRWLGFKGVPYGRNKQ